MDTNNGRMVQDIRVNKFSSNFDVKIKFHFKKVNGKTIRHKAKDNFIMLMAIYLKENGNVIKLTVMEYIYI
jgi:hypothetical protein